MKPESLRQICIRPSATIREAMVAIQNGAAEIALVVADSGVLMGVLTDGDIRRALLKGATLETRVTGIHNPNYQAVGPSLSRAEVLDRLRAYGIQQLPIVDEARKVLGVHLLREVIGGQERPNWAVLMAGGRGLRLDPITQTIPKPMLPVAGRPIIERLVLHLVGFGFRRIFVSIRHLGHIIEQHFGDGSSFGCRIEYLRENQPLGTGGSLSLLPAAPSHPVMVMNGDLVTDVDLHRLLLFHERGGFAATVCAREYSHTVPYGVLEVETDRVRAMSEKPTCSWLANAGVYVLSPHLLERIPSGRECHMPEILKMAMETGEPVGAFVLDREWIDVGQVEQLKRAQGKEL